MNAINDIFSSLQKHSIATTFGWLDVKQRYRRSKVGVFWLTLNMAVMIAAFALVFGTIFKAPLQEYLPFITAGMIIWTYFNSTLTEGCHTFIQAEGMVKQTELPLFLHVMRLIWRNLIILLHNAIALPVVFLIMGTDISWKMILALPAFLLLTLNLAWMSLLLATFCARFRDMPAIVANFVQVVFYLTPIIWMPSLLPQRTSALILELNPLYHLIELVRNPLLGITPNPVDWIWASAMCVIGSTFTLLLFNRFRSRVVFWL